MAAILELTEYDLTQGPAFAKAAWGDEFTPELTLLALTSGLDDVDAPLPENTEELLADAAQSVDLASLPSMKPLGPISATADDSATGSAMVSGSRS